MQATISYLSDIHFEMGCIRKVKEKLDLMKIKRPLFVTDQGVLSLGFLDEIDIDNKVVYANVQANPTEQNVLDGLSLYKQKACDGIIAIGGGSPMDCSKLISVLSSHAQPLEQYAFLNGGMPKISSNKAKLIAIPTTAGTGSEVGRAALINLNTGRKMAFLSPHLIPDAVFCDPKLTLKMPSKLTAGAGTDALSHLVETYMSPKFNPVTEAIALDGLKRVCTYLPEAVRNGANEEARSEVMMAALQGGLCFQKGLGLIHSLSHPLGALGHKSLHHGELNAVFLPHVLEYNAGVCKDKMSHMAAALSLKDASDVLPYFEEFLDKLGVPRSLSDMGVVSEDLDGLAEKAFQDHCTLTNPRKATLEDCETLYRKALS